MKKILLFTVAAFAYLCLIGVMSAEVFADGTEALGVPSIKIESGSGVVAAGVGLANNLTWPGVIEITVPDESTVKQVLLYWEGSNRGGILGNSAQISVNGNEITGDLIGGPYHPYLSNLDYWKQHLNGLTFRADITALKLVSAGNNTLTVSTVDGSNVFFDVVANGAGLLVIYEDASSPTEISIRDGHDFAFQEYNGLLNVTAPQTFKFSESVNDRIANLNMFFTSVKGNFSTGGFRPTAIVIKDNISSDPVVYDNELDSNSGQEWDTFVCNVDIPAGATSLTIQAYSWDRMNKYSSQKPASFTWVAAALSVQVPEEQLGSIGDLVWYDENNDGIQDAAEGGISGVTVNLYNCSTNCCSNNWFSTAITDPDGKYLFTDLQQGNYCLEFIEPDEYVFSRQDQGADDGVDSDADPVTGKTVCIDLEAGENDLTWDAGLIIEEECGPCEGKITELTLQYNGTIEDAIIKVVQKKDSVELFEGMVHPGESFTFVGEDKNDTMGTEIIIYVTVDGDGPVSETKIHTSCSQPIGPGLKRGDFEVLSGYSKDGGLLCPIVEDDDCKCDGKVTQLTLQYNGTEPADIEVLQKKDSVPIFVAEMVQIGEQFTFVGEDKNGTMGTEIIIYVNDDEGTKIHTSCSQPIGPGLKSGDFLVVEGESLKGGPLCPVSQP